MYMVNLLQFCSLYDHCSKILKYTFWRPNSSQLSRMFFFKKKLDPYYNIKLFYWIRKEFFPMLKQIELFYTFVFLPSSGSSGL